MTDTSFFWRTGRDGAALVSQDYYVGRKIASDDAARVLEIIGTPDAAAAPADTTSHKPSMGGQ